MDAEPPWTSPHYKSLWGETLSRCLAPAFIPLRPDHVGSALHPSDIEQAATGRLLDLVRSFVTMYVSWKPLFIGAGITGDDRMRLYFRSPERDSTYGVDVLISHTGPGLLGSLVSPAFLANEHLHQPSDDPHCGVIVDLTDY